MFYVDSLVALEARTESAWYPPSPEGGFFSASPYFEFLASFVYAEDAVSLNKHVIVEAERTRTFDPEAAEFAVVARQQGSEG